MAKKKKVKRKIVNQTSFDWSLLHTVIILTVMAVVGITREFYHDVLIAPPTQQVANYKKIIQPNAIFYSQTFLSRNKTFITFPFKFDAKPQPLWLTLQAQIGQPAIQRLVMHPMLYELSWRRLESDTLSLYQRERTYSSVEDFLKNPPANKEMRIDDPVITITGGLFKDVAKIDENTLGVPDTVGYILTSYKPPLEKDGWFHYEAILNAETAQANANNELVWHLQAPKATEENPFYLGDIHIDYRQ
jgi:hypothetical protein